MRMNIELPGWLDACRPDDALYADAYEGTPAELRALLKTAIAFAFHRWPLADDEERTTRRSARSGYDCSYTFGFRRLCELAHKVRSPVGTDYSFDDFYSEAFKDIDSLRHDVKVAGRAHDYCYFHIVYVCSFVVLHFFQLAAEDDFASPRMQSRVRACDDTPASIQSLCEISDGVGYFFIRRHQETSIAVTTNALVVHACFVRVAGMNHQHIDYKQVECLPRAATHAFISCIISMFARLTTRVYLLFPCLSGVFRSISI